MSGKRSSQAQVMIWKREEVRGLFVIGVLAILFSVLSIYDLREVDLLFVKIAGEVFAYVLIIFWGLYSLMMVFAVSEDIFSENTCRHFYSFARMFLFTGGFLSFYFLITIFFLSIFLDLDKVFLIISPLIVYGLYQLRDKILKWDRKVKIFKTETSFIHLLNAISGFSWSVGAAVTLVSLVSPKSVEYIHPITIENIPIVTFVLGSGWVISTLLINRCFEKQEQETQTNKLWPPKWQ